MNVIVVPCLEDNYAYVLHEAGEAIVIDPSEAEPVARALHGLTLKEIWCTHHHGDHVGGVEDLKAPVVIGSAYDLEHGRIAGQTRGVKDGEAISRGFRVLEVPGHTLGAIAFVGAAMVFTGDTLFQAGCGRLFEGTAPMLHASLARLAALDPQTRVYCGHDYGAKNLRFAARYADVSVSKPVTPTVLADELKTNPFLGVDLATFTERRLARDTF